MKQVLIQNAPLFASLTASEQETISARLRPQQFARGAAIFAQGDPADNLYLVQSGWVRLSAPGIAVLANLGAGSVFGEADLFLGRPRGISAVAMTDVEIWSLNGADLSALLERNPQMGIHLSQAAGCNLVQMEHYLVRRLSNLPGWGELHADQLAQTARALQPLEVPQGRFLFQRGEKSKGLYLIERGALQVTGDDSFVEMEAGQTVGEMALLADKPHTQEVRAIEDTMLWMLPHADFILLSSAIPELRNLLSRNLRSALSNADQTHAINQLHAMPLFAGVSGDVLRALTQRMLLQHVPAREIIFRQGQTGDALYLVEMGDVELTASLDSPGDVLARVGPGGFFGEMSLLTGRPSAVNARAVNEVNLWVLYRKDFEELMGRYPALSMAISRALAARLADANERSVDRHLSRIPLFAGLTNQQLDEVANRLTPERYRQGETIFVQNETGHTLYLIETGRVSLTSVQDGREYDLPTLHSGDFFGERSLLTGEPHTTTATAVTDVDLWTLGREEFESLVQHNPILALNISRSLTRRLQAVDNRRPAARPQAAPRTVVAAPSAPAPATRRPVAAPAPVMATATGTEAPAGLFGAIWGLGQAANNLTIWFQSRTVGMKLRLVAVVLLFIWLCGIAAPLSLFGAISQRASSLDARNVVAVTQKSLRIPGAAAIAMNSQQTVALAAGRNEQIAATPTWTSAPTKTPVPTDTPLPTATPTNTPVPTDTPVPTATPTYTPPPTRTPRPAAPAAAKVAPAQAKAAPQAAAPVSGNQYVLKEMRRLTPCENKGNHNIFGLVIDAAGNPIDGITFIQTPGDNPGEVLDRSVSGSKGPGKFEFIMWKGAEYAVFAAGDGQSPNGSDIARPLHSNFVDEAECAPGEGGNTLYHNSFAVVFVKTR